LNAKVLGDVSEPKISRNQAKITPANFFVAESLFAFACLRGFDLFEILVLKTNALRRKRAQNMPFTVEPERHQHHQGLKPVIGQTADIFQLRQDSF
jgi:hypothetical protein